MTKREDLENKRYDVQTAADQMQASLLYAPNDAIDDILMELNTYNNELDRIDLAIAMLDN